MMRFAWDEDVLRATRVHVTGVVLAVVTLFGAD